MNILLLLSSSILCYLFTKKLYSRLVVNYPKYIFDHYEWIRYLAIIINVLLQLSFFDKVVDFSITNSSVSEVIFVMICFIAIIIISSCIAIATAVDIATYELPDEINLIIFLCMIPISFYLYSGKSLITGVIIFLIYFVLAIVTNSFGMGDVKLGLALGIGLKHSMIFKFIFIAFLLAAIVGTFKIISKKSDLKSEIAFGPYIALSFILLF